MLYLNRDQLISINFIVPYFRFSKFKVTPPVCTPYAPKNRERD